jgi:hypothetical protein
VDERVENNISKKERFAQNAQEIKQRKLLMTIWRLCVELTNKARLRIDVIYQKPQFRNEKKNYNRRPCYKE